MYDLMYLCEKHRDINFTLEFFRNIALMTRQEFKQCSIFHRCNQEIDDFIYLVYVNMITTSEINILSRNSSSHLNQIWLGNLSKYIATACSSLTASHCRVKGFIENYILGTLHPWAHAGWEDIPFIFWRGM